MFDRFQLALQTHLGSILIFLVIVLCLLFAMYAFLWFLQRRRSAYSQREVSYFDEAAAALTGYRFHGEHTARFFGRESVVRDDEGNHYTCLMVPSKYNTDQSLTRFRAFAEQYQSQRFPVLASYETVVTDKNLITIQRDLLHKDGRKLIYADKCFRDGKVTTSSKETILLDLAHSLKRLHASATTMGESLYHGFLLPCNTYIDFDATRKVSRFNVANTGLAFALGPEVIYERLQALRMGKLQIDKFEANALLEQMRLLPPEQLDSNRLHEVGPRGDMYSFAALATSIFCESKFISPSKVSWENVPERWHPFLRRCLQERVSDRPNDFEDLEEWLYDPELSLTYVSSHDSNDETLSFQHESEGETHELSDLQLALKVDNLLGVNIDQQDPFTKEFAAGVRAIKMGRWEKARKHFQKAVSIDEGHCLAHIKLAISLYELGDMNGAEKHYHFVKEKEPQTAKVFRKHIAFRI